MAGETIFTLTLASKDANAVLTEIRHRFTKPYFINIRRFDFGPRSAYSTLTLAVSGDPELARADLERWHKQPQRTVLALSLSLLHYREHTQ